MTDRQPLWFALLLSVAAGCQRGGSSTADDRRGEITGPAAPYLTVEVRGSPVAGRPVPYRLTLRNDTEDVIVPISTEAELGKGGARWGRELLGEVAYDSSADRFVENPVAQRVSSNLLYKSALEPGEALVEEFEVRYERVGPTAERFRLLFHRLSTSEFSQRIYVSTGGGVVRSYQPVGLLHDLSARQGALLAGFFLRGERAPEATTGQFELTVPSLPAGISARLVAAGAPLAKGMSVPWAGGWASGGDDASVVVLASGGTRSLPGIPLSALHVIDATHGNVSFCVTGVTREEIAPLFAGYEIIPHKCLHVSVPRESILATLEKISAAGYAIKPIDFQLREALDVVKGK